jgi:AraC-like DNA-binding protein/ABC-type sugar transport system permease subunit
MKQLHQVLMRYTFSFFFFSLVLLFLFVPVSRYISSFTLKNELAYMTDKLQNGIGVIDSALTALNNMAAFTSMDSRFRIFKSDIPGRTINPYTLLEMRNSINNVVLSHSVIADMGILFSDDSVISSRRLFYSPGQYSFYDQFFRCENLSREEWEILLSLNRSFIPVHTYKSVDYGVYKAITFTVRWSGTSTGKENILFAVLPVKDIVSRVADADVTLRGYIRAFGEGGETLFEFSGGESGKFHVIRGQSAVNSLGFEIGIPDSLMKEKLWPVKKLIFVFSLITAFLTILLSIVFGYQSSKPMRNLLASIDTAKNIRTEYESYTKNGGFKLFNSLKFVYQSLGASISAVDAKLEKSLRVIEEQGSLLKARIFEACLHNGIYEPEENTAFRSVFPDFPAKFQLALVCRDSSGERSFEETLAIHLMLINILKNRFPGIYIQGKDRNVIVLLLPIDESPETWFIRLQNLRSELDRQIDLPLRIFLSEVFTKPSDLPRAWQQLQFIRALPGINYLTSVEDIKAIPPHNVRLPLNITQLDMIYNALCNANDTTACAILKECTSTLPRPEDPLVSGHVSDFIKTMINQVKLENPSTLFHIEPPVYIEGNQDELFNELYPECFLRICQGLRSYREKSLTKFGGEILNYIDEHLYDPNLYISMVSDHFRISPPVIQRLVKNTSGQTFQVYVENNRLSRAHKMLLEGVHTVQKVTASCGFANTNSFYKSFKRRYGFPPSEILNRNSKTINR